MIRFRIRPNYPPMCWQAFALSIEFFNQGWVVFCYKLVEQSLLRAMAFIRDVTQRDVTCQEEPPTQP